MNKIKALEGLRGVAALLIILFHAFDNSTKQYKFIENSWIAVDLFFVLSGFVIYKNYYEKIYSLDSIKKFILIE